MIGKSISHYRILEKLGEHERLTQQESPTLIAGLICMLAPRM